MKNLLNSNNPVSAELRGRIFRENNPRVANSARDSFSESRRWIGFCQTDKPSRQRSRVGDAARVASILGATALCMIGAPGFTRAQQDKHEEKTAQHNQQKERNKNERGQKQEQQREEQQGHRGEGGRGWGDENRNHLSTRNERRISEGQFRRNFGGDHRFRMNIIQRGGFDSFQCGGVWFSFIEPFPLGWGYTDDVYVDYQDGGYYLLDPLFPNSRVEVSIQM